MEFGDVTCLVKHIWSTFGLIACDMIWGSWGAPVSKWHTYKIQNALVIKWNGVIFGTQRLTLITHVCYTLDLVVHVVVKGALGIIRCTCLKLIWCNICVMHSFVIHKNVPTTACARQIILSHGPLVVVQENGWNRSTAEVDWFGAVDFMRND